MAGKIFVNYRRDDSAGDARGVRDGLAAKFGKANVFMDVDNLLVGERFDVKLSQALDACDILISVIGPRWMELLKTRLASGERDYVREEIAAALARKIIVIPVRVGREGAMPDFPRADALPDDISELPLYQKHDVAHERFGRDIADLIEAVKSIRKSKKITRSSFPVSVPLGIAIGLLLSLAGVAILFSSGYSPTKIAAGGSGTQSAAVVTTGESRGASAVTPPAGTQTAALDTRPAASAEEIDRGLQTRKMWMVIKREFPDWYEARVTEVARMAAERKSQDEITRYLLTQWVSLRRDNAKLALSAGTERHKELAAAFLANLKRLSKESVESCYDFISKGESSAAIVSRIQNLAESAEIEAQVMAEVAAIVEGRDKPTDHASPVKTDYDVLTGELEGLGWTQADMQLFASPNELAKAPPERVCNMLKDWLTAHLAIPDPGAQERLLFETLKPVVSG